MRLLPADKEHPPRPDWPVLRHITFTEIHAVELGGYFGLFVVWAVAMGNESIAFLLAAAVIRKIISRRRAKGGGTKSTHDVGFHDVLAEPQYFGFTATAIPLIYVVVTTLLV